MATSLSTYRRPAGFDREHRKLYNFLDFININVMNLQAHSHRYPLRGILCEQGNKFNYIQLFYVLWVKVIITSNNRKTEVNFVALVNRFKHYQQ